MTSKIEVPRELLVIANVCVMRSHDLLVEQLKITDHKDEYRAEITRLKDTHDQLVAALAAPEAPRQSGCCCPPKGHTGIWGAAMCPVHHGLRALVNKNNSMTAVPLSPDHSGGAGVVLPERECEDCFKNDQSEQAIGFNRAIDKVKELNQ